MGLGSQHLGKTATLDIEHTSSLAWWGRNQDGAGWAAHPEEPEDAGIKQTTCQRLKGDPENGTRGEVRGLHPHKR